MTQTRASLTTSRPIRLHGQDIVIEAHSSAFEAEVLVGVTLHNHAMVLHECLGSIIAQRDMSFSLAVVLLDDNSTDDWRQNIADLIPQLNFAFVRISCGSATSARNCLLDLADEAFPKARWVARLDADDRFSSPISLSAAVRLGELTKARFVLGGNRLRIAGQFIERTNPATPDLFRSDYVLSRLEGMSRGLPEAELPSCNLLLATHVGWRYPTLPSAEDHWLVANLLLCHKNSGAILSDPFYADYSLSGEVTASNHQQARFLPSRKLLYLAADAWACEGTVLGCGWEGVVIHKNGEVQKHFREEVLSDQHVEWLRHTLRDVHPHLPVPVWSKSGTAWTMRYPWFDTLPVREFALEELRDFFIFCLTKNIVCTNINRGNFRRRLEGGLVFVDLGRDVLPMNVDYFRDACARGFALANLGWSDEELRRRTLELRDEKVLYSLPGFEAFYDSILQTFACQQWMNPTFLTLPVPLGTEYRVTLVIKACAMDALTLATQLPHIVGQLERPRLFAEKILAIDPYRGPFLRPHSSGDWELLISTAANFRSSGVIDRVLVAPEDLASVSAINERWFNLSCTHSHSATGVPVVPQLWAFDQVKTRYVLQCDVDVFIGRRDLDHDFLGDMLTAVAKPDVFGVAFNIPHAATSGFRDYEAPLGSFVPEVRCGLLDLERINKCLPLPNHLSEGRLALTWYRSLQKHQETLGMRTLRGGDPRTFYLHPPNSWKQDLETLDRVRDLASQGIIPPNQNDKWDLSAAAAEWKYDPRPESIVFVIRGRNTPLRKIERCLHSLLIQSDQDFGIVLLDDGSDSGHAALLPQLLHPFTGRFTLVRRSKRHGYMPNTLLAVRDIISSPDTLAAVLDLDDALIHRQVVSRLRQAASEGADIVLGAMFRPDKPLKLYHPDFVDTRTRWGGEVWIHLRSFRKRLLDYLPDEHLKLGSEWIDDCEDFATMIPLVEMANHPVYLPEYLYFHERSKPTTPELRTFRDAVIRQILDKPSRRPGTHADAPFTLL